MTTPGETREAVRKDALDTFLADRVAEGFTVETRTDTHAIIVPRSGGAGFLDRFRKSKVDERQVVEVDEHGTVTMSPAQPLRS
jgi:hypothetical protein